MYHGNIKLATTHILSVFSLRRLIRRSIESTKPPHVCTSVLCSTAKLSWSFNTYCLTLRSLDHDASVSLFQLSDNGYRKGSKSKGRSRRVDHVMKDGTGCVADRLSDIFATRWPHGSGYFASTCPKPNPECKTQNGSGI